MRLIDGLRINHALGIPADQTPNRLLLYGIRQRVSRRLWPSIGELAVVAMPSQDYSTLIFFCLDMPSPPDGPLCAAAPGEPQGPRRGQCTIYKTAAS